VPESDIGTLLPPNSIALFGRVYGGSSSDKLRTTDLSGGIHDIRLESNSYALVIVPILPELGEPIVFDTYTTPSYAKSTKSPSTIDDQLFIIRRWDSGATDVTEYDLETFEPLLSSAAVNLEKAVIGDTAYHYSYPKYDNFTGWRGNLDFVQEPLDAGPVSSTTVRNVQSYLNDPYFPFALIAAGQNLYGVKEPSSDDPSIVILRVDQSTGEPTEMVRFTVREFGDYGSSSWQWVVDNGFVYWVAARNQRGETIAEIFWHELERESEPQSTTFMLPEGVTGIWGFDVDDGYFVLEPADGNPSELIIFDLRTEKVDVIDLGIEVSDVAIIRLGE